MKKIIAMILVLTMVFGLVACGKKDVEQNPTQEIEQTDSTGAATESTSDPTEAVSDDSTQIDGRQELWEKVFTEGTFKVSANSLEMIMPDGSNITILSDPDGKAYLSVSGTDEEGNSAGSALYKQDDSTAYFHSFGQAEGQAVDEWYICEMTNEEDSSTIDGTISESGDTSEMFKALESIEKIVYVKSVGDLDYVDIYCAAEELNTETWETTYDVTISFEYDGQVGEMRYTENTYVDDWGTSSSMHWKTEIDSMELFDWDFDKETMTLVHESDPNQVLKCTVVKDHLNDTTEKLPTMRIVIHSETYEVSETTLMQDGYEMTVKFINCDDVSEFVELPDNIEEKKPAEDAVMEIGMMMFAVILSQAQMG